MMEILYVILGGIIGVLLRFATYKCLGAFFNTSFPTITLIINCLGSFVFGALLHQIKSYPLFGVFFAMGVLGSFTTFSTFSYESIQLLRDGKTQLFIMNITLSVVLGLSCFSLGLWLNQRID